MTDRASDFIFTFHPSQREAFRAGTLVEYWLDRYPMIFDGDDRRLVQNQPHYHFFEWLGAVLLYEATGYRSLVEGYAAKAHALKRNIFAEHVGMELLGWATEHQSGQPDLFAYRDPSDWFFCEVKGGPDRLRENQRKWMVEFETMTGKRVRTIQFNEFQP